MTGRMVFVSSALPEPPRRGRRPSRPEPPRKAPLDRDRIVDAALRILDAGGLDAVSMRGVAESLGTGPASLYAHVSGKDELLSLLIERLAGEMHLRADPSAGRSSSRARGGDALRSCSPTATSRGRAWAPIALGEGALRVTDRMIELLELGGLKQVVAHAVDLLPLYRRGAAFGVPRHALHGGRRPLPRRGSTPTSPRSRPTASRTWPPSRPSSPRATPESASSSASTCSSPASRRLRPAGQHRVVHGEQRLGRPRGHAVRRGPHRPLGRARAARAARASAKKAWCAYGSGSLSSAWTSRPASATSPRTSAREKKCRCPIAAASARFAGRAAERLSSRGTSTSTSCATRAASASSGPGTGRARARGRGSPGRTRRPRRAPRTPSKASIRRASGSAAARARRRAPTARSRRTPARARAARPAGPRRRSRSRPGCAAAASSLAQRAHVGGLRPRAQARQRPRRSASAASGWV